VTRVKNNLTPYSRNPDLDKSARLKCQDMVKGNYYEHDNPKTGEDYGQYFDDLSIYHDGASENLAQGYFINARVVIDGWMGSESHRASIVDPKFTEIGFATCIVPKWPDELTIVQHKIVPPTPQPQVQNNYYQQRQSNYRPSTTTCTHYDSEYLNDRTTCSTY